MVVSYVTKNHKISERRACRLIVLPLSSKRYQAKSEAKDEQALISLVRANIRYGYRRLKACLAVEGLVMNHKKVYRLYKKADLMLSRKKSKKLKVLRHRTLIAIARGINERWSMDFVSDKLTDGRKLRCLNIIARLS